MSEQEDDRKEAEERLLLIFAEDARAFTADEAREWRKHLAELLETRRQSLLATPDLLDQYVVELIYRCPNLLDAPVGFDWVFKQYKTLLHRCRIMPNVSARYWNRTIPEVRKLFISKGSPQSPEHQQRDIYQTMAVHMFMNTGMNKNKAVEAAIAAGAEMGLKTDQHEVYRALKRVEERVAGTWQDMLRSPNTEANQKNITDLCAILRRQSNPETATTDFTQEEEALIRKLSNGLEKLPKTSGPEREI